MKAEDICEFIRTRHNNREFAEWLKENFGATVERPIQGTGTATIRLNGRLYRLHRWATWHHLSSLEIEHALKELGITY